MNSSSTPCPGLSHTLIVVSLFVYDKAKLCPGNMIYMIDPINITITHALGWINKDKYANCSGSHRRQAPNATEGKKDLLNRHRTTQQKHLPVSMSSASRPGLKIMVSLNLFLLSKYCLINVSLMDYPLSSSEVVVKKTGLEQKAPLY